MINPHNFGRAWRNYAKPNVAWGSSLPLTPFLLERLDHAKVKSWIGMSGKIVELLLWRIWRNKYYLANKLGQVPWTLHAFPASNDSLARKAPAEGFCHNRPSTLIVTASATPTCVKCKHPGAFSQA